MAEIVTFSAHALDRLTQRCWGSGLDLEEARKRVFETVEAGSPAYKKHRSKKYRTYERYYPDGLCFYVICQQKQFQEISKIRVVTIIIEEGRS